jgi:putative NADH-flavin reductase
MMRLLIFGASGKTGLHLTQQALHKNYTVSAFVRNPQRFPIQHNNLQIIKGNVADYDTVFRAIRNQDAVISALGAKSPFQNDRLLIQGVEHIVNAMERNAVKRLVYLSFLGVKEYRKELGFLVNYVVPLFLKKVIQDHEAKESIIISSSLDWTIIRPPRLTNGKQTGNYRHGEHILSKSLMMKISRADLAAFMLQQVSDSQYIHQKPRVMY